MTRVQKNKIMILVTSFIFFSIFGIVLIYEILKTPNGPKDQELTELCDRIVEYLDGGTIKYTISSSGTPESYVLVSYSKDKNTMTYESFNWLGTDMKEDARKATIVLVDLVLKGENDMNIKVIDGLYSKGDRLLSIEVSQNDILVISINGSNFLWAIKMSMIIDS